MSLNPSPLTLPGIESFLDGLFLDLAEAGILIESLHIDHIAYRASSREDAESLMQALTPYGECIDTTIVSGRPIMIYQLDTPLLFRGFSIDAVELMYPKGDDTEFGWDHIECLLGAYTDDLPTLEKRVEHIIARIPSSLHYAMKRSAGNTVPGQQANPTVTLLFPHGAIRFHTLHIIDLVTQKEA